MDVIIDVIGSDFEPEMVENLVDRELHIAVFENNFSHRAFGKFRGVSIIEDQHLRNIVLYWGTGSQIRCDISARIVIGQTTQDAERRKEIQELIAELEDDLVRPKRPWYDRPFNTWFGGGDV